MLNAKSYEFAKAIIKAVYAIQREQREYVLTRQLLRSGTSIGAQVREAEFAQSRSDFIHKLSLALKEANEASYWLDLLHDTGFIPDATFTPLAKSCKEQISMLVSSLKTLKSRPG